MRLVNEVSGYEEQLRLLKSAPHATAFDLQEANRLKHAISLVHKYIAQEVITRAREGKSLDDIHELEEWENIKFLPVRAIQEDTARGFVANAVKFAERVGYRVTYEIHSNILKN